jgi:hypothetical protein
VLERPRGFEVTLAAASAWPAISLGRRTPANDAIWFNERRPHQALAHRTPGEVQIGTSTRARNVPLRAVLEAEPMAGDRYLPVLPLRAVP